VDEHGSSYESDNLRMSSLETVMPVTESTIEVGQIAELLGELSHVQGELLDLLKQKQLRMASQSPSELLPLVEREQELTARMQACYDRRATLLAQAESAGLPGDSIASLAHAVEGSQRGPLSQQAKDARSRMRLLQHHSLVNWVLAQRALLHVAQLLEIIATGGRMQPTYGRGDDAALRGNLLNGEA
jgi:flagellar biosynthesis/type III secretory pathway chaperone